MLIHKINFKVHGVTFDNEDNINIQDGIVKVLNEYKRNNYFDKLYCGYSKKEIIDMDLNISEYEDCLFTGNIKKDIFEGKNCYKVYIDTYNNSRFHIGYAPKSLINEISEWIQKNNLKYTTNIYITGGKCKHCVSTTINYEDTCHVEITELAYGFNVELRFYDDTINTNTHTKENKKGIFEKIFKNKKG